MSVPTAEDDPRLMEVLRQAADEWGSVRVALTAALMADPAEVVQALAATGTVICRLTFLNGAPSE